MIVHSEANFKNLIGKEILFCYRNFHEEIDLDMDDVLFQELDGDTYLFFSDGLKLHLYPNTENFSLEVDEIDEIEHTTLIEVSKKQFWNNKLNVPISDVELLFSTYRSNPYGLNFILENNIHFKIFYESEGVHDFDALIIKS